MVQSKPWYTSRGWTDVKWCREEEQNMKVFRWVLTLFQKLLSSFEINVKQRWIHWSGLVTAASGAISSSGSKLDSLVEAVPPEHGLLGLLLVDLEVVEARPRDLLQCGPQIRLEGFFQSLKIKPCRWLVGTCKHVWRRCIFIIYLPTYFCVLNWQSFFLCTQLIKFKEGTSSMFIKLISWMLFDFT